MRSGFQLRLKDVISLLMVLIACPIIAGLIFYMHQLMSDVAEANAAKFIQKTREESIDNTTSLIEPVKDMVVTLSEAVADFPELRRADINKYLYQNLEKIELVRELYIGYADGSFRQVVRLAPGVTLNGRQPPADAAFATRIVDHSRPGTPVDRFSFFRNWGEPQAESTEAATYDPRTRPYYIDTARLGMVQISDPYISATTREPEITVSAPILLDGQTIGVVGADITLHSLSQFLKDYPASPHGITVIADRKGLIIAHPAAEGGSRGNEALDPHTLMNVSDRAVTTAALERSRHAQDYFKFIEPGSQREYLALFAPFPASFGKPWEVVIVVPTDDFIGDIYRISRLIIIVGGVALICAIVLIYMAAALMSRPLERLAGEIDAVRSLTLDRTVSISSSVLEIKKLIEATKLLKSSISAFAAFVPRGLVQELLKSDTPIEIGGQSRYLTVMFTDIKNFSTMAEAQPVRELFIQMSSYLETVTRAVNEEFGTVDKFIGDGVMAFWGAPALRDDHAYRACVAAIRAQRRMERCNAAWTAENKPELHMRIGIHTDAVLVGNVGSAERLSYTVFGDGVNVAARLEGTNKEFGTWTCVSHSVYREAGEKLWLRPIDQVTVKGRRGDLVVYELLGIRDGDAEIAASPEQQRLCVLTAAAFEAYTAQNWTLAASRYEAVIEAFPDDTVVNTMLARCRERLDEKPPLRQVPS
jgi:adenylate cyclase